MGFMLLLVLMVLLLGSLPRRGYRGTCGYALSGLVGLLLLIVLVLLLAGYIPRSL